eukprot:5297831-Prorocentrum_lima.AAC.1
MPAARVVWMASTAGCGMGPWSVRIETAPLCFCVVGGEIKDEWGSGVVVVVVTVVAALPLPLSSSSSS